YTCIPPIRSERPAEDEGQSARNPQSSLRSPIHLGHPFKGIPSGRITMLSCCRQCSQALALDDFYCSQCGAAHQLATLQAVLWLGCQALLGAVPGALLGAAVLALVAAAETPLTGSASGSPKAVAVLSQLGALCGALLGAIWKAVSAWNRRQE